jgi:hypothetical protein
MLKAVPKTKNQKPKTKNQSQHDTPTNTKLWDTKTIPKAKP